MYTNYIIKSKSNKLISFFYTDEKNIFYKVYEDENWSAPKIVIKNVQKYFTVNLGFDGKIYLFCQNDTGDIVLCIGENNAWNSKIILKNQTQSTQEILFNAIIDDNKTQLIYNINPDKKTDFLVIQSMTQKGWDESRKIDKVNFYNDIDFHLYRINKEKSILMYHRLAHEFQLGYRELNEGVYGDYNIFHKTNSRFFDYSCVTTHDTIHLLYIVKTMFSTQVIYKKKDISGISDPVVLFEGQNISQCNLFIVKNTVYASWIQNKQLFYSNCKINSDTFSKPIKDNKFNSVNPAKAVFVSYENLTEKSSNLICNEVFINNKTSSDILLLPEIYPEFYQNSRAENIKHASYAHDEINELNKFKDPVPENNHVPKKPQIKMIDELNIAEKNLNIENFERLKNQVSIAQNQASEKDKQLMALNNIIQSKNNEILEIERMYSERIKALNKEIEKLSGKISDIQTVAENATYKEKVTSEELAPEHTKSTPEPSENNDTFSTIVEANDYEI